MANTHSAEAGAILPDLCAQAKGAWYVLLGFLAFYAVTIMSTTDADFLVGSRQISIALLGVSVPTERFFFLAPIVAIVLYSNLHYYCLKIWSAAAVAPPRVTRTRSMYACSARSIGAKTYWSTLTSSNSRRIWMMPVPVSYSTSDGVTSVSHWASAPTRRPA